MKESHFNQPTDADAAAADSELVRLAQSGKQEAFAQLVARYYHMVYVVAYGYLKEHEAAEDMAQETFLRAYANLATLRNGRYLPAWLNQIARNHALNWLKQGTRRSRVMTMLPVDSYKDAPDTTTPSARDAAAANEEAQHLEEAVLNLPEDLRTTVLLHYSANLSKSEIARRLNVHPSSVGRQLDKALALLREKLGKPVDAPSINLSRGVEGAARTIALVAAFAAMSAGSQAALLQGAGGNALMPPGTSGLLTKLAALPGNGSALAWVTGISALIALTVGGAALVSGNGSRDSTIGLSKNSTRVTAASFPAATGSLGNKLARNSEPAKQSRDRSKAIAAASTAKPASISTADSNGHQSRGSSGTRLAPGSAVVSGYIRDASTSEPVEGASLTLAHQPTGNVWYEDQPTSSSSDGYFQFTQLPTGLFQLRAQKDALRLLPPATPNEYRLDVKDNAEHPPLELYLYPGHTVAGVVREAGTHAPIAGAKLWSDEPAGDLPTTYTSLKGSYLLSGISSVDDITANLFVQKDGYFVPTTGPALADQGQKLTLSRTDWRIKHDVEMLQAVFISGTVRDEYGNPLPTAQVSILSTDFSGIETLQKVDESGQYKLEARPDTTAKVKAQAPGFGVGYSKQVTVGRTGASALDVVLSAGAVVEGIVVNENDTPVAGARVEALSLEHIADGGRGITRTERSNPVQSGQDGRFIVSDLPARKVSISAFHDGRPQSEAVTVDLKAGERKTGVRVAFRSSNFLAGRITFADGAPAAGVEIRAVPSQNQWANLVSAKSHSDGSYRLDDLPAASIDLRIHDTSRKLFKNIADVKTNRNNADFILGDEYSVTMIGYVLDAQQKPVGNFTASSPGDIRINKDASKPGVFTAEVKPEGSFTLSIDSPDHGKLTETVTPPSGTRVFEKNFQLGAGGSISGTLIDKETSTPMAGVSVYIAAGDEIWNRVESKAKQRTTTTAEGTFNFSGVDPGNVTVMITPPPPLPQTARKGEVQSGQELQLGVIEVGAGSTVRGVVTDSSTGQPVAGVPLELIHMSKVQTSTVSAADGTFNFPALAASSYAVRAPQQQINTFFILSENEDREIEIDTAVGKIALNVQSNRAPVGGAGVSSLLVKALQHYRGPMATTDSSGKVMLEGLVPGRWQLNISVTGSEGRHSAYVDVQANQTAEHTVNLSTASIAGTVVNSAGKPIADAAVALAGSTPSHYGNARKVTSQADGSFNFTDVEPDTYSLSAVHTDHGSSFKGGVVVQADGSSPAPVQMKLQNAGGTLISKATNSTNGQPASKAWCRVRSDMGEFVHGQVRDDNGVLRIPHIPAGTYQVAVGGTGLSQLTHQVEIKENETVTLEDALSPSSSFTWMLTDAEGKPATNVRCKAVHTTNPKANREGLTNELGLWYAYDLLPGQYQVTATSENGAVATGIIELQAGKPQVETSVITNP